MAITDPVTGVRQTPEQIEAITAQQREGIAARLEGKFLKFHELLTENRKAIEAEKARVDSIEQARKQAETAQVGKVAEHIAQREGNLVLVATELKDRLDRFEKDFSDLVSRINGLQPGFFTQTPVPPRPGPGDPQRVTPTPVPVPPARPMRTTGPAQTEAERQAQQRQPQPPDPHAAAKAEQDRQAQLRQAQPRESQQAREAREREQGDGA